MTVLCAHLRDRAMFDAAKIVPYAYRHSYAQRHADAGVYLVPVQWEWTVPAGQGFWATGFFSRRTTVTELRDPVTSRKICAHAGIPDD